MKFSKVEMKMNKAVKNFLIILAIFIGAFFLLGITSVGYVVYQFGFNEKGVKAFGEFSTNFNNAQFRAKIARSNADIRMMSSALAMFQLDNGSYPLPNDSRFIDDAGLKDDRFPDLMKLTMPISYIASYQKDPLNPQDNKYRYFSDGKSFYILVSNGPDTDIDIDERLYTGDLSPIQSMIYDSSNGLKSSGDIIHTNQGSPGGAMIRNIPPLSPPAPVEVKKATGE